jgi:hypothetical protein
MIMQTTADEIVSGDRRRALTAVLRKLADDFVIADPTVSAQLASQIVKVTAELDGLVSNDAEVSPVASIVARRAARDARAVAAAEGSRRSNPRRRHRSD